MLDSQINQKSNFLEKFTNFFINTFLIIISSFLTFIHFLLISLPFYLAIIPILNYLNKNHQIYFSSNLFNYLIIMLLVLTILYILLDVIFGFTIKEYLKNTILVNDSQEYAEYHLIFEEVKSKFNIGEVKFLLNNNEEINAFAIATFRKNYIIVSKGMINHIDNSYEDVEDKIDALKGLLAHEFSHLVNLDFLPNLILLSGLNVSNHIDNVLKITLNIAISLISIIPIIGNLIATIVSVTYNLLHLLLQSIYTYVISPIYKLIETYLSRLIEYRSDIQSAEALGWQRIYKTLYLLLLIDGKTYHSKFSTHPNTISRILKIYGVSEKPNKLSISIISKYFGLFIICILFFYLSINLNINEQSTYINMNNLMYISNSFLSNLKDYSETLIKVGFVSICIILCIVIIKNMIFHATVKNTKRILNTTENTPIDILLFFAIENNDKKAFLQILNKGANLNTNKFENSIIKFAEINNPKFYEFIIKLKD